MNKTNEEEVLEAELEAQANHEAWQDAQREEFEDAERRYSER